MADSLSINVKLRFLLLLALMLAAQNLALIHDFDHLASGGSSPCLVCSIGSSFEAAVVDSGDRLISMPVPAAVPVLPGSVRTDSLAVVPVARGPPTFL